MRTVWLLFWDICCLRQGPERVPTQLAFVALIVFAYLLLALAGNSFAPDGQSSVAWSVMLLATLMLLLFCYVVLKFKGLTQRFVATVTALFGVEVVLGVMLLPFMALLRSPWSVSEFALCGYLMLMGWELAVRGFIFHRAFNVSLLLGSVMALTLFLLTTWLNIQLFPQLLTKAA